MFNNAKNLSFHNAVANYEEPNTTQNMETINTRFTQQLKVDCAGIYCLVLTVFLLCLP